MAGTSTDLFFFPIDTLKTRLQAKGGFFANGGYKGVYRGIGSAFLASAPGGELKTNCMTPVILLTSVWGPYSQSFLSLIRDLQEVPVTCLPQLFYQ